MSSARAEIDPDPSKPVYVIDPKKGLSALPVDWCSLATQVSDRDDRECHVDLSAFSGHQSNSTTYALTYVFSLDERSTTLLTEDAQCRVWVNGVATQRPTPDSIGWRNWKRVPIVLQPGRNSILIKTKSANLMAMLSDTPVAMAWESLKFGDPRHAVKAYSRVLDRPAEPWIVRMACFAAILAGDSPRYREFAKYLPTQFKSAPTADDAMLDAKVYCSVPVTESERLRLQELLELWYATPDRPQSVAFRRMAATAHFLLGEFDQVVKLLEEENDDSGWPILAMAYHRLNQPEQAERCLDRARTDFDSWLEDPRGNAQGVWLTLPAYREACQLIHGDSADVDGRFEEYVEQRRSIWEAQDPLTSAFDAAIRNAPQDVHAWIARGKRLAELGRLDEAEADFHRAVAVAPNDQQVLTARGIFYADHGQADKAAADFRDALVCTAPVLLAPTGVGASRSTLKSPNGMTSSSAWRPFAHTTSSHV